MRWKVGMSHMDDGRLHAYLDEELTVEETEQLRAHLAACAECRERLDVAREVRTRAHAILRLADPPAVEMPDFATLRARGVRPAPAPSVGWRQRSLLLPWAASLVLALGAGWFAQELIRGSRGGGAERVAAVQSESMEAAPPPVGPGGAAGGAVEDAVADAGPQPMAASAEQEMAGAPPPPPAAAVRQESFDAVAAVGADQARAPERVAVTAAPADRTAASEGLQVEQMAALKTDESAAVTMRTRQSDVGGVAGRGAASVTAAAAPSPAPPLPPPSLAAPAEEGWPVEWVTVNREAALAALGAPVATIARLSVEAYQVGNVGSRTAVRVLQRLPGGELVEVLQRAGGAEIELRAEVTADSLARLREGVRR
jgi:hypothetical protein